MTEASRPNILLLYTDQQRADALGVVNREVVTPNLDALTKRGARFSHHFVQNPLCMPSRVSMLAGQYPHTLGITDMGVPVPTQLTTIPNLMRTAGYTTANIGKLHFLPHANRDHRAPHPRYGFDHLEISDEPGAYNDAYLAWVKHRAPDAVDRIRLPLPPARAVWERLMGGDPKAIERDDYAEIIPFPADDNLTHCAFVADRTIDYLRTHRDGPPFMCIAGFYSPHPPLRVPQRFLDLYDRAELTVPNRPTHLSTPPSPRFADNHLRLVRHGYYAMVSEVDHHVGRLLAELTALGLTEDTIVVLTSDHGEWLGDNDRYAKGYPGDDPVSQVPLVLAGPNIVPGIHEGVVEAIDLAPTLLELAGIQAPPELQGRSVIAQLSQLEPLDGDHTALTEGTSWKSLRSSRYRYLIHADGQEQLWDLANDSHVPVDTTSGSPPG